MTYQFVIKICDYECNNDMLTYLFTCTCISEHKHRNVSICFADPYIGGIHLFADPYIGGIHLFADPYIGGVHLFADPYIGGIHLFADPYYNI